MPKHVFFEAVPASSSEAQVSCYMGVPTTCPECGSGGPEKCVDFHASRQVSLADTALQEDLGSIRLCPENMTCINCAAAKVVHYPESAFGAGRCGPLGIEQILLFCKKLSEARSQASAEGEKAVAVFCSDRKWACNNMLLLIGAYMILEADFTYQEVLQRFPEGAMRRLYPLPWRKTPLCCSSSVSLGDCLYGLEFAMRRGWFNFKSHGCKEYLKALKTFDACAMFSVPIGPQAEHRLIFWAVGDPVTTVADPSVRPEPPEEGFVTDYQQVVNKAEWHRYYSAMGDDCARKGSKMTDPGTPNAWSRAVSLGSTNPSACISRNATACVSRELTLDQGDSKASKGATVGAEGDRKASKGTTLDPEILPQVFFISEDVSMYHKHASISEMDTQEGSRPSRGPSGASGGSAGLAPYPLRSIKPESERPERGPSFNKAGPERGPSFKDGPEKKSSLKEMDTWLEQERVRRWGLKQHLKSSSVPFAKIKTRGLITMPEFAEWLRVVKCRRLVRLNYPDEPNLPPGGSYGDYFTGWGITQKACQFEDGTQPPDSVVRDFQKLVTELQEELNSEGVTSDYSIVVHCTAGLGRTATLLGVAAAHLHGMGGSEWLGWARMVRPGAVQTLEQERFLKKIKPHSDHTALDGGGSKNCCKSLMGFFGI